MTQNWDLQTLLTNERSVSVGRSTRAPLTSFDTRMGRPHLSLTDVPLPRFRFHYSLRNI